jgi:4-amino-4-deoxy-L-arabinose transferase-like glycosyltransferase
MAWKIGGICPDAMLYLRMAQSLEHGDASGALEGIRFNLFPVVLMLLHRSGMSWEMAGAWWGVAISSCTILPLFGWVRRQFDDRVALAACFLLAVHPGLIRWSPEVLRDPTFWFLFTLSLYFLWRAVTELRLAVAAAAGLSMALAVVTRFEGLLLLVPLGLWSLERGWARPDLRRRLVLGGFLCLGVYPLLLGLISGAWLRGQTPWQLVRTEPLELAGDWVRPGRPAAPRLAAEFPAWAAETGPAPLARMIEQFASAGVKGITPIFLLGSLVGMIGAWQLWNRPDRWVLLVTVLPLSAAIWIHLWWGRETSSRYFFPAAILMSPCAALGLNGLCGRLAAWCRVGRRAPTRSVGRRAPPFFWRTLAVGLAALDPPSTDSQPLAGPRWPAWAAAALPAILVAAVGLVTSLGSDCRFRTATVELGQWARRELGPRPLMFGPDGVTQVVSYYAHGQCQSFPAREADGAVAAYVALMRPDLVLLPADRQAPRGGPPLVERIERLGFVEVDRSRFAGGCCKVLVLRRAGAAANIAPAGPSQQGRAAARQARMPEFRAWMALSHYC